MSWYVTSPSKSYVHQSFTTTTDYLNTYHINNIPPYMRTVYVTYYTLVLSPASIHASCGVLRHLVFPNKRLVSLVDFRPVSWQAIQ